jgi:DNA-dependent RNA polymerase auxiliary subunit epsilon
MIKCMVHGNYLIRCNSENNVRKLISNTLYDLDFIDAQK